jgi:hypothetical protein
VKSIPLALQTLIALLFTAAGVWIMMAPVAVGYQDLTTDWTAATTNDVLAGAALVLISLGLLAAQVTATVRARLRAVPTAA